MSGTGPTRIGVLLSGRGSNFLALHDAMARGTIPAQIALVASNVDGAVGLSRAEALGLETLSLPHRPFGRGPKGRRAHDTRMVRALLDAEVDWVCLAGYMRILSPVLVAAFPRRILNIHPSLLPSFPGLDAQQQALDHGVRVSGCTVHLVDEGLDSGPIIEQRTVPVLDGDDAETLSRRILVEEHRAYSAALTRVLSETWRIEGRRLVFGNADGQR